jgi:putative tricarboxylic transport membrane protein
MTILKRKLPTVVGVILALVQASNVFAADWAPSRPVEFIVPAGTGGGADQMARFLDTVITKHKLMPQPFIVQNRGGAAGADAFIDMKMSKTDGHKIIITLSSLFTTPHATGIPFNWKNLTPVSMLALDQFVLWVNHDNPAKTTTEYMSALKAAQTGHYRMGGTGSKQEDQIITVAMNKSSGKQLEYIPFRGGGDVAKQLVANRVDSSVNNPLEALAHWKSGKLRPLCVFDSANMPYSDKVTDKQAWSDIPTCKSQGLDIEYLMLRGIFMEPNAKPEQVAFYVNLFKKVRALPEWAEFVKKAAFRDQFMEGEPFKVWLAKADADHGKLMDGAGFVVK